MSIKGKTGEEVLEMVTNALDQIALDFTQEGELGQDVATVLVRISKRMKEWER